MICPNLRGAHVRWRSAAGPKPRASPAEKEVRLRRALPGCLILAAFATAGPVSAQKGEIARAATLEQGGRARPVPSAGAGHGPRAAAGRLRAAPADGGGLPVAGAAFPQRGPRGPGRAHRGRAVAARPSRLPGRGVRHRRALADGQPRRELDVPLRRRIVDHHRRVRAGRCGRPGPLPRHRREQLQPDLLRRAPASSRARTAAGRGRTSASPTPTTSAASWWTRAIRRSCTWRRSGTSIPKTTSVAFTRAATEGGPGAACSSWTSARA